MNRQACEAVEKCEKSRGRQQRIVMNIMAKSLCKTNKIKIVFKIRNESHLLISM